MTTFDDLFEALRGACDPRRQKCLATYFGDGAHRSGRKSAYPGLTAVAARRVALRFAGELRDTDLRRLLASDVDEHRYVALEMLVRKYETGRPDDRERIAKFYVRNLRFVDHWVLVDTSAPYVLGAHLSNRPRTILFDLASSQDPMMRRISIIATAAFIRAGDFDDTLRIAELLLSDDHPLIHRAVGWMLREVGKRSRPTLIGFLDRHTQSMPRLMLRYCIDQLPEGYKKRFLRFQTVRRAPGSRTSLRRTPDLSTGHPRRRRA